MIVACESAVDESLVVVTAHSPSIGGVPNRPNSAWGESVKRAEGRGCYQKCSALLPQLGSMRTPTTSKVAVVAFTLP